MNTGQQIGPYVVLEPLGKGNMGEVYLATNPAMPGRRFAEIRRDPWLPALEAVPEIRAFLKKHRPQ